MREYLRQRDEAAGRAAPRAERSRSLRPLHRGQSDSIPQNFRAQRQIAHCRRSAETSASGSNGRCGVALQPVEVEPHGSERDEGRQDRRRRRFEPPLRLREPLAGERAQFRAVAATTPGLARLASKSATVAPCRLATSAGKSVGRAPAWDERSASMRVSAKRAAGRRARIRSVEILPARRDARGEPQPRALALGGVPLEGGEGESPAAARFPSAARRASPRPRCAGRAKAAIAARSASAAGLPAASASRAPERRFAPPGEPHRRQIAGRGRASAPDGSRGRNRPARRARPGSRRARRARRATDRARSLAPARRSA